MLPLAEVQGIMRRSLESGEAHFEEIRDVIAAEIEDRADFRSLCVMAADKVLSLAVAAERSEDGERLAFPDRDRDGERIIVHTRYTHDPMVLRRAGVRKIKRGRREIREGRGLIARAEQIEMELFPAAA